MTRIAVNYRCVLTCAGKCQHKLTNATGNPFYTTVNITTRLLPVPRV